MRLKQCREAAGFSPLVAAIKMDISRGKLNKLESDPNPVLSAEQIIDFANLYRCEIQDLFIDPIEKFVDMKRFKHLSFLLSVEDIGTDESARSALQAEFTISEAFLLDVGLTAAEKGEELSDRQINAIVRYLTVLQLIGIPVGIRRGDFSEFQEQAYEKSEAYLESINELRRMWNEANRASI